MSKHDAGLYRRSGQDTMRDETMSVDVDVDVFCLLMDVPVPGPDGVSGKRPKKPGEETVARNRNRKLR